MWLLGTLDRALVSYVYLFRLAYVHTVLVKLVFVVALAMVIWTLSCAQVGPSRQTAHGIQAAPTTWPNMSQCFGG